ncbi:Carbon storage regulator [Rhodopirellula maiorica SM1]|uniref:Translational regulator CsrA n=1 Tax=Rhodopirellula maiorica SM1 TaxID=1265738 RepID=M5RM98_9BACT|nr:carbon storage regulator [Rhodopirellula maiorica]EMI20301.1 Carbon storage regulator [Rhodopirellula maiorica SM1]
MLVLTRKLDEKIQIGNDITITLIRVQGNTVRIGIEAPRDIRVIRAELEALDETLSVEENPLSEREEAFAHPTTVTGRSKKHAAKRRGQSTAPSAPAKTSNATTNRVNALPGQVYMTRVPVRNNSVRQNAAPLSAFLPTDVNVGIAQ